MFKKLKSFLLRKRVVEEPRVYPPTLYREYRERGDLRISFRELPLDKREGIVPRYFTEQHPIVLGYWSETLGQFIVPGCYRHHNNLVRWCFECLEYDDWNANGNVVMFRNPHHALMFQLVWNLNPQIYEMINYE